MSFPKYSEYKDSGVEWLGSVPSQWNIFSIKRTVDGCRNGIWGNEPDGDNDVVVIRVADFNRSSLRVGLDKLTYRSVSDSEYIPRALLNGDLLIEKSGGGEKTLVGCVVLFGYTFKAVTSNFVGRMRPLDNFDSNFLCYCFDALYQGRVNYPAVKQTTGIQNLDSEAYLQEQFCFPPFLEQTQIARFLDHETAKIDALIEQQQRLIELLKEKRQAVISHAVTKGLDPTVSKQDSGVEWLGEVPAHWRVIKLGLIASDRCDGPFGSALKSEHYSDEGVRVIRLQNIKAGWFNGSDKAFIDVSYYRENIGKSDVVAGDLLIAGLGDDNNSVGRACVAPKNISPAMVKADCFRFRLIPDVAFSEFIALQLTAGATADAGIHSTGSTRARISLSSMSTRLIALPPLGEQKSIVSVIQSLNGNIDSLFSEAHSAIAFLQERRSALISAAVTGKIDIRDWKPPMSESKQEKHQEIAHG